MDNYVLINIYNEGYITWIGEVGPVFGYSLPIGLLDLIKTDPMINMELTTPDGAAKAKREYFKKKEEVARAMMGSKVQKTVITEPKKESAQTVDSYEPKEELVITTKPVVEEHTKTVEEDVLPEPEVVETEKSEDDEIDEILEREPYVSPLDEIKITPKEETEEVEDVPEVVKVKKYSTKELNTKTKQELKDILINERGYTTGMWAPKYHDKLSDLIRKIQKTQ